MASNYYSGTPFTMKLMGKYNAGPFRMKVMGVMKAMKHRLEFPILSKMNTMLHHKKKKMKTMATKFKVSRGGIDKRSSDYNLMPAKEGDFIVK